MVEQAGSVAGFAAVIGLAVLSALYFSQARDLRRLREWAGRAPERAAEMGPAAQQSPIPGRVVAVPQRAPQPATPAAGADKAAAEGAGAASNGDAAPAVAAAKPEGEDAEKPTDDKAEGDKTEGEKKEGEEEKAAEAKPGMPAPASAAAAAASAGAAAASVSGPAAPAGSPPSGAPAGSPPSGTPSSPAQSGSAPAGAPSGSAAAPPTTPPKPGPAASGPTPASPTGTTPAKPATPQRPPGSVLPPRTGTLPPVRRLPSSPGGVSPAQTGVLGGPPEKRKRNPLYVALAVVGVLVVGAAAAVGVPAIVNGAKDDNKSSSTKTHAKTTAQRSKKAAPAAAPGKITVAVLNGTSIPGLAAQIGDRVDADGFTLGTVSNASPAQGQRANSVAMYAAGHESDARLVAHKLGIRNVTRVDASSQQIAGDATVVVIVGSDKTQ